MRKLLRAMKNFRFWTTQKSQSLAKRTFAIADRYFGNYFQNSTWNGTAAVEEGMKASSWVYSCIDFYIRGVHQVQFKIQVWNKDQNQWVDDNEHPALLVFENPNPQTEGNELLARNMADLLVNGNFITTILDSDTKKKDPTLELWAQNPNLIVPLIDPITNLIFAYQWSTQGRPAIDSRFVVHGMFIDPNNPGWGMSPLQAAARPVDTEIAAQVWNQNLLENRTIGSGNFTTDVVLTKEQYNEIKAQILEQHQGASNSYQPWVLGAGMRWDETSKTPVDVDFINQCKLTATQVCAVFKVHPPCIGLSEDATLANLREYIKDSWNQGIIPNLGLICRAYNRAWIRPRWGSDVRLWYDLSQVEALKEARSEKIKDFKELVYCGVRPLVANRLLELGLPEDFPEMNVSWIPKNLIPAFVGDENSIPLGYNTQNQPAIEGEIEGSIEDDENESSLDSEKQKPQLTREAKRLLLKNTLRFNTTNLRGETDKKAAWKAFESEREKFYQIGQTLFEKLLKQNVGAVAKNIRNGLTNIEAVVDSQSDAWRSSMVAFWREVVDHFGENASKSLKLQKADFWNQAVRAYVSLVTGDRVVGINTTTKTALRQIFEDAQNQNLSNEQIADQIQKLGDEFTERRSLLIAQNETISASNFGNQQAALQSKDVVSKTWLSQRDGDVRHSHQQTDGETIDLNAKYSNGLAFPGDPRGRPSETIGCRCIETYTTAEEV